MWAALVVFLFTTTCFASLQRDSAYRLPVSPSLLEFARLLIDSGVGSSHHVGVFVQDASIEKPTWLPYERHPEIPFHITLLGLQAAGYNRPNVRIDLALTPASCLTLHFYLFPQTDKPSKFSEDKARRNKEILRGDFTSFLNPAVIANSFQVGLKLPEDLLAFALGKNPIALGAGEDLSLLARMGYFEALSRASYHLQTDQISLERVETDWFMGPFGDMMTFRFMPDLAAPDPPLEFLLCLYREICRIGSRVTTLDDALKLEAATFVRGRPQTQGLFEGADWTLRNRTTPADFRKAFVARRRLLERFQKPRLHVPASPHRHFECESLFGPVKLVGSESWFNGPF